MSKQKSKARDRRQRGVRCYIEHHPILGPIRHYVVTDARRSNGGGR